MTENQQHSETSRETELIRPDPSNLRIDETNERKSDVDARTEYGDLEESIKQNGVVEPITVRENEDGQLSVIAGQRRTLAAQAVGEDSILAIKRDLSDEQAILYSILENDQELNKNVSKEDRAKATKKLVEKKGTQKEAAEALGVDQAQVSRRLERTRDDWKGTIVHTEEPSEVDTEELNDQIVSKIRQVTDGGESGERVIQKVISDQIPNGVVRDAAKSSDSADEMIREMRNIIERKYGKSDKVRTEIEFGEDASKALRELARDRGASEKGITEHYMRLFLKKAGYLDEDG